MNRYEYKIRILGSKHHTKTFKVLLKFYHKKTSFMGVKFSSQYTQQ